MELIINDGVLVNGFGDDEIVKIPEGVREISRLAFIDNDSIRRVILPSTLETVGRRAFYSCRGLEHVAMPSSLRVIEDSAFAFCESLFEVFFPRDSHLEVIESEAFYGCESLKGVRLPESLRRLGKFAFMETGCELLRVSSRSLRFSKFTQSIFTPIFSENAPPSVYPDEYRPAVLVGYFKVLQAGEKISDKTRGFHTSYIDRNRRDVMTALERLSQSDRRLLAFAVNVLERDNLLTLGQCERAAELLCGDAEALACLMEYKIRRFGRDFDEALTL